MIMHVIFGKETKDSLGDKFTFLELDTFVSSDLPEPLTAYAVIGGEGISVDDIPMLENYERLHNTMIKEYKQRNWNYCHQALEHLKGRWRNELDSFYEVFESRIKDLETKDLPVDWDGTIPR